MSINLTLRTITISILLGFGAGVLGTALTTSYLSDYAAGIGATVAPPRLFDERPRATPATYADAVREVSEAVLPGVASFYPAGSYAESFASGAVLTSDGWILTSASAGYSLASARVRVGGKTYPVERTVDDPATGTAYVKVAASDLSVFAFGSGFDLVPGDQVFAAPSASALFVETVVEAAWPAGAQSSDVPSRRVRLADPLLGAFSGAPVVNARGELVGLVMGGGAGFTDVLPTEGALATFASMLRAGEVSRPALGVTAVDLSRTLGLLESQTLGYAHGALLVGSASVKKGSAAALAGIVPGEIILSVDGTPIDARRTLDELIVTRSPGDTVTLRVASGSGEREVVVVLGDL